MTFQIPTDFSVLTAEDLTRVETDATAEATPLVERVTRGERLNADETQRLEALADAVTRAGEARTSQIAGTVVDGATQERAQAAAGVFSSLTPGDTTPPATPETPAGPPRVGQVAQVTPPAGPVVPVSPEVQRFSSLVAAPNLPTVNAGHVFETLDEVAAAMSEVMKSYSNIGPGQYVRTPVMTLRREFPAEARIGERSSDADILRALDFAADETRLEGGSLVAAAGWCAPSETDYSILEIEAIDGILSLPEVQISRGGINFTVGPDFAAIFGGTGFFHQTEAQVIAATPKTCMVIPCPSFTDVRLEVDGVCITGAFLQDRGYPEMVARFVRGALVAHAHKLNIFVINKIVAGSTLFDYTNVANLPLNKTEAKDATTVSKLLAVAGIQIMDMRYKYRMRKDATVEAVLPYWVVESMRGDIQRRTGLDPQQAFNLGIAQIEAWFAVRGARVQWVYDWLDAYNTTNTSTVGQTAGVYTLPTTVDMLLYPAGTWVKGVADVVRLDNVYDSTNLVLNQYVRLFSEEGILVAKRGYESRRIRVAIAPSGATSATVDMRDGI